MQDFNDRNRDTLNEQRVFAQFSEYLPKTPAALAAVSFAAGVGIGALVVHSLSSRTTVDPMLARIGRQAIEGINSMIPSSLTAALAQAGRSSR